MSLLFGEIRMKTFNEKDLITWSNRDKAVLGNKYYFAHTLIGLQNVLKSSSYIETLKEIDENDISSPFSYYDHEEGYICNFACILPVDAVKKEKTYRACRNVKELYELIFNTKSKADTEFYINELVGTVIHFKQKGFDLTYYECISGIVVYNNGDIDVRIDGCNFELPELFKNYKIEINGEWVPFGVLEK